MTCRGPCSRSPVITFLVSLQAPPRGAELGLASRRAVFGGIDLASEVAGAGVDCGEDAADCAPVGAALAALQSANEGRIDLQLFGDLFLRHPRLLAKRAQCLAEDELLLLGGGFSAAGHLRNIHESAG